jgi:murein L,D-transpeptidase YafK
MHKYLFIVFLIIFTAQKSISLDTALPETDYILVEKAKRLLSLYHKGLIIKQYKIALGFSPIGHKEKEGDGKTPEGKYFIIVKNNKSTFYLSLKLSYPSEEDIIMAKNKNVSPGSNIMIHGIHNGFGWIGKYHTLIDWTKGCIALTNQEIEEIYSSVKVGTIVEIKP